jgi:hypothetical protein
MPIDKSSPDNLKTSALNILNGIKSSSGPLDKSFQGFWTQILIGMKSILDAKDETSLDKIINQFKLDLHSYILALLDVYFITFTTPDNETKNSNTLLAETIELVDEIVIAKKKFFSDSITETRSSQNIDGSAEETTTVSISSSDPNVGFYTQSPDYQNTILKNLEVNYIDKKWGSGLEKKKAYDSIKATFIENYDIDKLKALLHLMALPRKNGFFTASYAETGSIRAFMKLINSGNYPDLKNKILSDTKNLITTQDIITFIGTIADNTKHLKFDEVQVDINLNKVSFRP